MTEVALPADAGPSLVVAVGRNGAIGRDGTIPWRAPEDQAYFKHLTMGHTLVVGSATWTSFRRVLPGRRFVVVSRRTLDLPDGVVLAGSPDAGLDAALETDVNPIIAGGSTIYDALLPRTRRAYVTDIDADVPDADTHFSALGDGWIEVATWTGDDPRLVFRVLDRTSD